MKIYEQKTYYGDNGITINAHIPLDRETPVFFAIVNHHVPIDGQQLPDQFKIDIPAATIEAAFDMLPTLAPTAREARIEQVKAAHVAQKRQLVLPSGQRLPPSGHPKTRIA